MKRIWNFIKSVIDEMKIVVWPNARQTRRDTSIVIWTTVFFTIFLGALDKIFEVVLKYL